MKLVSLINTLLCGVLVLAQSVAAAETTPPSIQARRIAPDTWLIPGNVTPNRQPDGNTVVFVGRSGLIVFDTGRHIEQTEAIAALARELKRPVQAIINSHWHLDHVSGNPALKAMFPQATVYASDAINGALAGFLKNSAIEASDYLKTPNLPQSVIDDIRGDLRTIANGQALKPDVVVNASASRIIDGKALQINFASNGPTAGDLWLYDAVTKTAIVGDLVTLPVPFFDTACVEGWRTALDTVAAVPFELLVPGHGEPMKRAEFNQYRSAFDKLTSCSASAAKSVECAQTWLKDTAGLRSATEAEARQSTQMVEYYVDEVLRPNGGNSKFCVRTGVGAG